MGQFKFTEEERREIRNLFDKDQSSVANASIDRIESLISERDGWISVEERLPIEQIIEKWTKEMEDIKIHIKNHEDTFGYPAVTSRERLEAISDMLADIKQLKISAPYIVEVERLKSELANNTKADISIADLRKVFAHRASMITEDLNQGANQLMTLTDFKTAVADMGWRIGFDQLAAANQRIAELESEIKYLNIR